MNLILAFYNDRNIMFRNKSISELNHFTYLISCDVLIIHYCGEFVNNFFRISIIYFLTRAGKYIIYFPLKKNIEDAFASPQG